MVYRPLKLADTQNTGYGIESFSLESWLRYFEAVDVEAVLISRSCPARRTFFSFFCWFLATYSIKFYIIGFVSSCCVQWAFDCRVLKSVDGIIGLESSSQFQCWLVDSCVLLSEARRHVCRPTRCLLLRRQRSSVVCQLSTICVY